MTLDRLVLTCDHHNFSECLHLARECGTGLEVQVFALPHVLDGDWRSIVAQYKREIGGFTHDLSCHGAFYDLASGSPDPLVQAVARQRYLQNLDIAYDLGARTVVFHANYLPQVDGPAYRASWSEQQVAFWSGLAPRAEELDVTMALENMWEPSPVLLAGVIDCVGSSHLKACIDVGHAHLYSHVPFEAWLEHVNTRLVYVHMNNNSGTQDDHRGLEDGVIDYRRILPSLRAVTPRPIFALEIESVEAIRKSLEFLEQHA